MKPCSSAILLYFCTDYSSSKDSVYSISPCTMKRISSGSIVLTGVYFEEKKLGAATYDQRKDSTDYLFSERIPGSYHGTGDVFASALLSGLLNNFSLSESAQIAVNFTADSIRRTYNVKTDYRFGVNFEQCIPDFLKELKLI